LIHGSKEIEELIRLNDSKWRMLPVYNAFRWMLLFKMPLVIE